MKAAWDWHLPMETEAEQRAVVEFAHELGFDTLIVRDPTEAMARRGEALGIQVVAIVYAHPTEGFAKDHPECLQRMLPVEEEIAAALSRAPEGYQHLSHRWFQMVQDGDLLCFEHPESREELKGRVSRALEMADGVSFDGFGFLNHYACFCDRCQKMREEQASNGAHEAEGVGTDVRGEPGGAFPDSLRACKGCEAGRACDEPRLAAVSAELVLRAPAAAGLLYADDFVVL